MIKINYEICCLQAGDESTVIPSRLLHLSPMSLRVQFKRIYPAKEKESTLEYAGRIKKNTYQAQRYDTVSILTVFG